MEWLAVLPNITIRCQNVRLSQHPIQVLSLPMWVWLLVNWLVDWSLSYLLIEQLVGWPINWSIDWLDNFSSLWFWLLNWFYGLVQMVDQLLINCSSCQIEWLSQYWADKIHGHASELGTGNRCSIMPQVSPTKSIDLNALKLHSTKTNTIPLARYN